MSIWWWHVMASFHNKNYSYFSWFLIAKELFRAAVDLYWFEHG